MKANTSVLIIFVAIAAGLIGFAVNSPSEPSPDSALPLLKAQLLAVDASNPETTYSRSVEGELGSLTLVNFWATWCAPCREEMPMFEDFYQQGQKLGNGFVVIGITIDRVDKSLPMLDSMGISYPIFYAENTGMELMASVGNAEGLLPYTLLLDKSGEIVASKLGRVHAADVQLWLEQYL